MCFVCIVVFAFVALVFRVFVFFVFVFAALVFVECVRRLSIRTVVLTYAWTDCTMELCIYYNLYFAQCVLYSSFHTFECINTNYF